MTFLLKLAVSVSLTAYLVVSMTFLLKLAVSVSLTTSVSDITDDLSQQRK